MAIVDTAQINETIGKALEYLHENYKKYVTLDEVSRFVNISPYYFSKIFKEEVGFNFIDYLTRIRREKAKQLLNNKELSVKEICLEVGYNDPNYFSRLFKKQEGITPTDFREN